jgi:hypothetical protein
MLLQPRRRWAAPARFAQALVARRAGKPPVWWHLMGTAGLALVSTGGLIVLSRGGADRSSPQTAHLAAGPNVSQAPVSVPAPSGNAFKADAVAPRLSLSSRVNEPAPLPPAAPPSASGEPARSLSTDDAGWRQASGVGAGAEAKPDPKALPDKEASVQGALVVPTEAPTDCLPETLRTVLTDVAKRFGSITVVSTQHLKTRNHAAGSARHKLHEACKAVDVRLPAGRVEAVRAYLRSRAEIAGVEAYRDGVLHMDVSESRAAARAGTAKPIRRAQRPAADAASDGTDDAEQ